MLLALLLILSILPFSGSKLQALEMGKYIKNAETLKALGLFEGTSKGFELTKNSTRAEAAVMLVRLLGATELALNAKNTEIHPFLDVPAWANPYISYLYSKGLTKGNSITVFGSNDKVTANQYTTMILRALGYNDQQGVFKWDKAVEFANTVGLIDGQELTILKPIANKGLIRDEMARLSYKSLFTNQNNTQTSLLVSLFENKVISTDKIVNAMQIDKNLSYFFKEIDKEILNENEIGKQTEIEKEQDLEKDIDQNIETEKESENLSEASEMRAVWISYIELKSMFASNKTKEAFQTSIRKNFEKVKEYGLGTVIVHVRPFSDAIYPSKYAPWSHIVTGKEGVNPGYDPFQVMVDEAHRQGLKIEAWLNPFRIRSLNSSVGMSSDNQAASWLKDGSNRVIDIKEKGIIYNPGNEEVRTLLIQSVTEILENYDVDGIHFDDYFYPNMSLTYDTFDYNQYKSKGGSLTHKEWRRENINLLVKAVYSKIKAIKPEVQFGISPQGSFEANYEQQYIDVQKWVSNAGYVDYICPQLYYGYLNSKYPYAQVLEDWNNMVTSDTVKLYIGLTVHKVGRNDKFAGVSGANEWITDKEIIKNMVQDARTKSHYSGFMLYRYEFVFDKTDPFQAQINQEINALESILN